MKKIIKTLYDIEWLENELDNTLQVKVWPIKVIREGILPGCFGVTITAINKDGLKFHGNPKRYHKTEQEAMDYIKEDIIQSLGNLEEDKKQIEKDIERLTNYLNEKSILRERFKNCLQNI